MTSERRERIKAIIAEALDLPDSERHELLDQACGSDFDLRREVESLLAADLGPLEFLERPILSSKPLPRDEVHPTMLGSYRILHEIGRGGLGVVYLAQRSGAGFEQYVAIKILKTGMDSDEIRQRFLAERQILARLEHPNIARLLDGGVTENGRPFFVMEYVKGRSLDDYCRDDGLSLRKRLELFRKACSAVQYAHNHLVVHRDIKPRNILVTDEGEPKLLDFGIAKIMDPQAFSGMALASTRPGQRWLTLNYASPEQMTGQAVSTLSDVYSMGVVLFEMLTGKRPFDLESVADAEARRIVCDVAPDKPSAVVEASRRRSGAAGKERSAKTGSRSVTTGRELKGDLDMIVLKALRKEPDRRYASAESFAEDIHRFLTGRTVRAQPDTLTYRSRKFIARNIQAVGLACVLFMVVIAAAFINFFERRQAEFERDRAEKVAEFMVGVFSVPDPAASRGADYSADDLLNQGREWANIVLHDQDAVRAEFLETIGRSYGGLGLYGEAKSTLEDTLKVRRLLPGPDRRDLVETLNYLGRVQYELADYRQARGLFQESLEIAGHEGLDAEQADSLRGLGIVAEASGELEASELNYRAALRLRRTHAADDREIAESFIDVAAALQKQREFADALPYAVQALESIATTSNRLHPQRLRVHSIAAVLFRKVGDYDQSESQFMEAIAIARRLYPRGHPDFAVVLNDFGMLKRTLNEHEEAEMLFRESLEVMLRFRERSHPHVAFIVENLAISLRAQKKFEAAESLYREALEVKTAALGPDHPKTFESKANLADFLWIIGRRSEAKNLLEEVFRRRQATAPEDPKAQSKTLYSLAFMYEMDGDLERAEGMARRSLELKQLVYRKSHGLIAKGMSQLASVLSKQGNYEECAQVADESLRILRGNADTAPWRQALTESIASFCRAQDRLDVGHLEELKEAYLFLVDDRGDNAWQSTDALRRLEGVCASNDLGRQAISNFCNDQIFATNRN